MALLKVNISVFKGSWCAPIWSAIEQGYFKENNLDVTVFYTPSSTDLIRGFDNGSFQLVFCSADNVIAYQENHAEIFIQKTPDAAIFLGGDSGFLSPVAAKGINSFQNLKGKIIGVDKRDTGFAYVLYDILEKNGIQLSEVVIQEMGSTEDRLKMIIENRCQMTLLRTPYQLIAQSQGLRVFNEYRMDLDSYQGTVGVVHRRWLESNTDTLNAFKNAYRSGLNWFVDHPDKAKTLLVKYLPHLSEGLADKSFSELSDKKYGLDLTMTCRISALQEVMKLRSNYEKAISGRSTVKIDVASLLL